ncbi:nuclease-related domain-containing protein [Neobacillus sp. YX16]|uniref:nuclease-related domain-containing protein n=1 Tax=Neobacillus sp. YX16 TaxID=3047874 RepID=UPI0024C26584|nr:nuclease-related domain-containing protein [Neobacillus sp. YX16]WHZ02370.1 nuclease-related domain-containing protein [Neobacillus sp. YX16]
MLTEILQRRLLIGNIKRSEVDKDLSKRWAGYWGEITLDKYLKELPANQYYIFYDLQLKIYGVHFQIDTLLISTKYILIIEAKNISGTLTFDNKFKQLIRLEDNEAFEDPRIQAKRNLTLLTRFFQSNGFKDLPIDYLVFFSNVKTRLIASPEIETELSKVCKAREIFEKIEACETAYQQERISHSEISSMTEILIRNHQPKKINILELYKIAPTDTVTGVRCTKCSTIPMVYRKGKWICSSCNFSSKDAHLEAINDFFLLIKSTVTNNELKVFLHLPSNDISQKILKRLKLASTGKTKSRIYHQHIERSVSPCGTA